MTKIARTHELIDINNHSVEVGRNRTADEVSLRRILDPSGFHVESFSMVHNGVEMRTFWLCKTKSSTSPAELILDMSFEEYDALVDSDQLRGLTEAIHNELGVDKSD